MLVAVVTVALPCANATSELRDAQATGNFPVFGMLLLLPARNLQEPPWHTHILFVVLYVFMVYSLVKPKLRPLGKRGSHPP